MSYIPYIKQQQNKQMHQIQQPQQTPPPKPQYRTIKPQPTQLTQTLTRIMTNFKNSIHDGYFTQSMKRQGPGITFMDNDSIIVGNYKNDNTIGLTLIFLSTDTYYIGQFNKGAIDGPFVIRTPNCTMYSTFVNNKIQGQLLMIDYENWLANLWAIQNTGQGSITKQINLQQIMSSYLTYQQIKRKQSNSSSKLDKTKFILYQQQIISHIAPYIQKLPNITQFLTNFKLTNNQYININGQQIFAYKFYQNNQIFYLNSNHSINLNSNNNQFIGVCLNKKEEVIAYGQFKTVQFGKQQNNLKDKDRDIKKLSYQYSYHLNGLGVRIQHILKKKQLKQTRIVCSGQFLNHKLHGQGCKYIQGQKTLYGKFIDDNIRNADIIKLTQQKTEQIKRLQLKYRKNKHIHSLKFYNNYTNQRPIYILNNLYETMIVNNR